MDGLVVHWGLLAVQQRFHCRKVGCFGVEAGYAFSVCGAKEALAGGGRSLRVRLWPPLRRS
ncbi:MAG: hypothetical protein ACETWB_01840 [Anaerolineae bacterium]